jgi:tRNA-dihydrouridine synthase
MKRFDWQSKRPLYLLAPMEGATDAAFRQVVIGCGRPDVCFTEFVNVDGLLSKGRRAVEQALVFEEVEQPLIAQLWGTNPTLFYEATKEIVARGFAGVDINMGCPDRAVIKKGAGGALINTPELAAEIIAAVKEGSGGVIPVSVKIRIGFKQIETEVWATHILNQGIEALTVHGRTVRELSKVPCHWDEIGKVVTLRNEMKLSTVIIGNGDVTSLIEADEKIKEYGVDGVMIGRGVFHNPCVFDRNKPYEAITKAERLTLLETHLSLYERLNGKASGKSFSPLKKYFKIYIQNFTGAAEMRDQLMLSQSSDEVREIILGNYKVDK